MLIYLFKTLLCTGVLYGYYWLALRNQAYHQWNRLYLIMASLLSLVLPLCSFSLPELQTPKAIISLQQMAVIHTPGHTASHESSPLGLIYCLFSVALLLRLGANIFRLHRLKRKSNLTDVQGIPLATHPSINTPFSFFRTIFWGGPDQHSPEGQLILRHELAHIHGLHSTDKLLLEIICACCWINPFFYLIKKELGMVHEFIADEEAGADKAQYARTLLQVTLDSRRLATAQYFGQSPVKRRISLLLTPHSQHASMKKLFIIPVTVALIALISWKPGNITTAPANVADTASRGETYTFVDQPPVYPGGMDSLVSYLSHNVHYPAEAQKNQVEGTVFVQFIVRSNGSVSDVVTVGAPHGAGLEEEAVRVVSAMPDWEPGRQKGKKVNVQFNLPLQFTLKK
jgi:TonB family protein